MADKPTSNANVGGRPTRFAREDVVAKALEAFWSCGFDQTSLSALESATGLDRSSIYNSFSGKRGLYDAAAELYLETLDAQIFAPLAAGTALDLGDVLDFLRVLEEVTASNDYPAGCFIVNDLGCPSRSDAATSQYFNRLQAGIDGAFERAGHVDPGPRRQRVAAITAQIVGVNAVAQHNQELAVEMIAATRQLVTEWSRQTATESTPDSSTSRGNKS